MKSKPRYFVHTDDNVSCFVYCMFYENGDYATLLKDGHIVRGRCVRSEDCEIFVRIGCWREITEAEAALL